MIATDSKFTPSPPLGGLSPTPRQASAQRLFDLLVAIPILIFLLPIFVAIIVWIKLDSRGPAFFLQQRVGRFGHPFRIFKFRSMIVEAEQAGTQITIGRDPRITRCGRILRQYRLDELPQLLNIIKGEMSLVGPRPEVPRYVALYTVEQQSILAVRPGLTSPATITFNNESELLARQPDPEQYYRSELIPAKIRRDLEYSRQATVWTDCVVICRTLRRILR
ncbi:MAG TPA: sugar transferase [Blastocatellia bacterium]|nr:sugar transferase [Blastocatellia bacterium]